jgi:lysylphosphatidylglycerol synthetase-like protein (DUF2156 family)
MELCNAQAMKRLVAEGAAYLHFGFTPFVLPGSEEPGANPLLAWALRLLARHGRFIYPARSQAEYKLKWAPDVVEPEFLAARPLSVRGLIDLLLVTRSI